ncbi:hypothetical protein VTK56DRAFT_5357 [Thermocarpiscus australiensis]
MATTSDLPPTSHDTALCLIPPHHLWPRIDRLRALYDKAYPRWPPHINLVYPFVAPESLPAAADRIASALSSSSSSSHIPPRTTTIDVSLTTPGVFPHRRDRNTIYLCDGDATRAERIADLRGEVLAALRGGDGAADAAAAAAAARAEYRMHLTVAQSEDIGGAAHRFLVEKVGLMPEVAWTAGQLHVLVREREQPAAGHAGRGASRMRLWGTIGLGDGRVERVERAAPFYDCRGGALVEGEERDEDEAVVAEKSSLHSGMPHYFEGKTERWVPYRPAALETERETPTTLTVASYNVLAEFEWPPSEKRYPLLLENMLAENAASDVLVLQEVTDGFLSFLLGDQRIRDAYPFCSHGPPDQDDIEPLSSFLNIAVLSKVAFDWEYVSFHRKHKGAVVVRVKDIGRSDGDKFLPVILAAVHLSHGLTDEAVAAKKTDIKRIIAYLSETYPEHAWILAGDFNVPTSSATLEAALKKKAISDVTAGHLAVLDDLLAEAKLGDAWKLSLAEGRDALEADPGKALFDGEQGATWDPTSNSVAAAVAGTGGNMRPQRYDRILVRGESVLEVAKFNMFGFLKGKAGDAPGSEETFASDHWGVRCIMNVGPPVGKVDGPSEEISNLVVPVHFEKAPGDLARSGSVKESLVELEVIPGKQEVSRRKTAFDLLKNILLDTPAAEAAGTTRPQPAVVVVPVGSYALDVWTSSSDIDVLCIGPFSSSTFFALASQRLRKAANQGIKILRRVRANTGTMLEVEVHDIKMDLQYCPATTVAERWPDVLRTPPSDPVWSLSAQTLSKLKAIRDIDYLQRSIPDLAAFRLAHRFIKTWAKSRGVYSARFGYLSGIQISILLARVCKLLDRDSGSYTVEDLLSSFFAHYASFDWETKMAFDPFFHKTRLPYTRTSREPLAILGYFPPSLNTALAASLPSTRTLCEELRRASETLRSASVTPWSSLLSSATAATDFLAAYKTYIKIDAQYWGLSLARGAQFLGWLESRCVVLLLVDLQRRARGLHARIWPARFVERAEYHDAQGHEHEQEQGHEGEGGGTGSDRDYRGSYLIGLDKLDPSMSRDELKLSLGALQTVLARFEAQMRGDERYFDARNCWLSAALVNRGDLGDLEVDGREWGEYTPGEEEDEEEETEEREEEEEEEGESEDNSEKEEYWASAARKTKKKNKEKGGAKKHVAVADMREDKDKAKRFRTAADVMNRIRWDTELDSSDYVIGYEDRFIGVQEKELEAWKTEQTDEEFIPQHRIVYFKRRSDGRRVWDRRTRVDELFRNGTRCSFPESG